MVVMSRREAVAQEPLRSVLEGSQQRRRNSRRLTSEANRGSGTANRPEHDVDYNGNTYDRRNTLPNCAIR